MRVLITGASGQIGGHVVRQLSREGLEVSAWSGQTAGMLDGVAIQPVNLRDPAAVGRAFAEAAPDAVIHLAAMASVAACHERPDLTQAVNVEGTAALVERAAKAGARLIHVSTDLIFDGEHAPYAEDAIPSPLSEYGRSKARAEERVRRAGTGCLIVRVSLVFGVSLTGRPTFFEQQLAAMRQGKPVSFFTDEWRTPLSVCTAARALAALVRSPAEGILHIGGPERMSRFDMGRRLAIHLGLDPSVLKPALRDAAGAAEPRPRDVSLCSRRWRDLFPQISWPGFEESLAEMGLVS